MVLVEFFYVRTYFLPLANVVILNLAFLVILLKKYLKCLAFAHYLIAFSREVRGTKDKYLNRSPASRELQLAEMRRQTLSTRWQS